MDRHSEVRIGKQQSESVVGRGQLRVGAPPTGCPPDCGCRQGHAGCPTAMATLDRSRGRRRLRFLASGRLRRQLQEKGGLQKVQSDVIHGLSQQGVWVSFWTHCIRRSCLILINLYRLKYEYNVVSPKKLDTQKFYNCQF